MHMYRGAHAHVQGGSGKCTWGHRHMYRGAQAHMYRGAQAHILAYLTPHQLKTRCSNVNLTLAHNKIVLTLAHTLIGLGAQVVPQAPIVASTAQDCIWARDAAQATHSPHCQAKATAGTEKAATEVPASGGHSGVRQGGWLQMECQDRSERQEPASRQLQDPCCSMQ